MKIIKCPVCGKIISTRFPVHECAPTRMTRPTDREIMQMDITPPTKREVAEINIRLSRIAASYRTTVAKMRKICSPVKPGLHYQEKVILWLMRDGR